ncbi:DUF1543 domain-containing protein [Pedobacter sp.]
MTTAKLFMILLGCKPEGRHTEQHDVFFAIANEVKDLVPAINAFWPEAKGKIHLDAYRVVSHVNGYKIEVAERGAKEELKASQRLFFMNLGGYQNSVFEELHYKMLIVANEKAEAIKNAKESEFFKRNFSAHIDDKYGVDVDDVFEIEEVLPKEMKSKYQLFFTPAQGLPTDELVLGYMPVDKL